MDRWPGPGIIITLVGDACVYGSGAYLMGLRLSHGSESETKLLEKHHWQSERIRSEARSDNVCSITFGSPSRR